LFLQARTAVAAARPIDLDHAFIPFIRKLSAGNADGGASYLQNITTSDTYALQVGWGQSGYSMTNIFDTRLGNTKCERCRERRWRDFRHGAICNRLLAGKAVEELYLWLLRALRFARRDGRTGAVVY
jgi:hypothetical protein